jgi:archaellum component FlaG (FlaF/FlaG flagellin family)
MPATVRSPQSITRTGLAPAYTAADNANGETCPNDGNLFLHVKNTGGGACTVSVAIPGLIDGQTVPSKTVVVPITTGDRMIGPFPTGQYNDSSGNIGVSYSTGTGVTAAYIHLG